MNKIDIKWDLDDIALIPSESSCISHRKECDIYTSTKYMNNVLPLMASPMDTVLSSSNYEKFIENGIIPCLPRGLAKDMRVHTPFYFQSFGLNEIEKQLEYYVKEELKQEYPYHPVGSFYSFPNILIDIANGHMEKLIPLIKEIKQFFPGIVLMVGNVANPETFVNLGLAGADYVRCSIGSGAGCTTAANVAINYPLGSLISECYKLKNDYKLNTKIVADGGMRNFADIIKALALGADFVMIGSIFNKSIESAGFNYLWKKRINSNIANFLWRYGFPIKKKYRGMSTKSVQRNWGKTKLVTAEGITFYQKVEYTLSEWVENFSDYTKSAMSYCNAKNLNDFIGKAEYVHITPIALKRFKK